MLEHLNRLPQPQQYGHMLHIQQLINELERLTRLDDGLQDARPFILTLSAGVEHSLTHGQPLVAALWLQDKLKSESEEGDMVDRSTIVKELTTVGKFISSDRLSSSKSASWSGFPVQPTMLSPHFGGLGGTPAFGATAAFGGTSGFGGFGGSPAWGNGSQPQQGGRGKGRGGGSKGGRTPRCNKCRNAGKTGQDIVHSFRSCPLTTCHKCGQNGHIERDCQN